MLNGISFYFFTKDSFRAFKQINLLIALKTVFCIFNLSYKKYKLYSKYFQIL